MKKPAPRGWSGLAEFQRKIELVMAATAVGRATTTATTVRSATTASTTVRSATTASVVAAASATAMRAAAIPPA